MSKQNDLWWAIESEGADRRRLAPVMWPSKA